MSGTYEDCPSCGKEVFIPYAADVVTCDCGVQYTLDFDAELIGEDWHGYVTLKGVK